MKRCFLFAALAVCFASCSDNVQPPKDKLPASIVNNPHTANGIDTVSAARKPTMDFADTVHNFGNIHEGEAVTYEFSFTNTGKTPLIISSASGSCGCTVPEYPHDPVQPGQKGIIKVTFNSTGKKLHQEKSVTIINNTVRGLSMLYIKAEVEPKK